MTREQLSASIQIITTPATLIVFFILLSDNFGKPVSDYEFAWPVIWSIVFGIVAAIVVSILLSIFFAKDLQKSVKDERDVRIHRLGEYFSQGFYVLGGLTALALAAFRFEYFWIGLAIFLAFNLANFVASIAKLLMYRFGTV